MTELNASLHLLFLNNSAIKRSRGLTVLLQHLPPFVVDRCFATLKAHFFSSIDREDNTSIKNHLFHFLIYYKSQSSKKRNLVFGDASYFILDLRFLSEVREKELGGHKREV